MPEMHLKQPGFTHSPCGLFTKNKKRIEKFIQTGGLSNIYWNDLDKSCCQHDIALIVATKIWLKEQNLLMFCEIKHLKLLVIQIR